MLDFLSGGGGMGERIRAFPWTQTPLGAPETWPQSLRSAISICLHSSFPTAIYWGPELRLLYNDAWVPVAADRHPAALGQPGGEVWSDIWSVVGPQLETVLATGEGFSTFDQLLPMMRDGRVQETYWNYSFTPIRGEDGGVAGVLNQGNETTERILRERNREAEATRQRRLFEQAPGFITVLRGPDHVFEFVNDAYRRLFGDRDFIGRSARDVFPELVGQRFFEWLDRAYTSGERFVAERSPIQLDYPGASAGQRFLDFIYEPVRDDTGRVTGIFCEGFDVTNAYVAEQALREQSAGLQTLNRIAAATIVEQDLERIVQLVTDAGRELTGAEYGAFFYNVVDAAGESYMLYSLSGVPREAFAGFPMPRNTEVFGPTFTGAGVVRSDDITRDPRYGRNAPWAGMPEGHLPVTSYLAVPVASREGGVIGGLFFGHAEAARFTARHEELILGLAAQAAIAIDNARLIRRVQEANEDLEQRVADRTAELTQAHETLRQAQKMEAVGQLTGGIAHDFNNLLAGISGSLEIIERRLAQGRADGIDRFLQGAQTSAQRAAALTQRLLAFSRRQTLDPKPTDVNRLVFGMEDLIRRTVGPAIKVEVVGAGGLWIAKVDPAQLESALLNLAINARDAMPDGGRLTIETANKWLDDRAARDRDLPPGQYLSICVTDTGTGIAADIVDRIFDPFFTTKPIGQGTGLGLSMIHGFVRQSGGQVRVYTEPGQGTTMCLYLPRLIGELVEDREELDAKIAETGAGETVLVVDDETTVRMLIVEILTEAGYRSIEADDGPSALKILGSDARIDLLITDVGLPGGMNGRQVADAARETRPGLKVLFVTGYAENAAVGNGHLEPGMEVITKPFVMSDLAAKIGDLLER
ncbi:ATP-binding protein [Sphingomonas jatrophae]|uniref:histidine kinase n=1 Tax=Sphingomonas jatrophae TaxID=1166337 RepID=A0A1I6L0H5_9SPHN|nr:ATP-binding protein [Sphingomonas jatrophae]SFR96954.1 PAS fold-containing protein [Sphingomonas jatrophae]